MITFDAEDATKSGCRIANSGHDIFMDHNQKPGRPLNPKASSVIEIAGVVSIE